MLSALGDKPRLIILCGGGMPLQAPTENRKAFISTVEELTRQPVPELCGHAFHHEHKDGPPCPNQRIHEPLNTSGATGQVV
jgi:hypothetical protein